MGHSVSDQPPVIVGLGEILWDLFPDGPRFGGAPANFACHVAALGGNSELVSAVGKDQFGQQALAELHKRRVGTCGVQRHEDRPTGIVTVSLDVDGHASYEFAADTAWDALSWSDDLARLAERTSAVCFGTLGQRSQSSGDTIRRFVAATRPTTLRIFDVNLRPPFVSDSVILESLDLANVLKLNDEELPMLAALCELSGSDVEVMQKLAKRFTLQAVALTRGPRGAVLIRDGQASQQPGIATEVVDTVGAGDAFVAALTIGLLERYDSRTIVCTACGIAAYVCSQAGATPVIPDRLGYETGPR